MRLTILISIMLTLSSCCTSTLDRGCDPMPKWTGYTLTQKLPTRTVDIMDGGVYK